MKKVVVSLILFVSIIIDIAVCGSGRITSFSNTDDEFVFSCDGHSSGCSFENDNVYCGDNSIPMSYINGLSFDCSFAELNFKKNLSKIDRLLNLNLSNVDLTTFRRILENSHNNFVAQ